MRSTAGICLAGLFMALTILFASYGVPVLGTHVYLVDCAITTAAMLFDPVSAMLIAGIGSFLGDMFFYPAAMFVSLFVHGLQGLVISWISHNVLKKNPFAASVLGVSLGVIIVVVGYTIGHMYFYSFLSFDVALATAPFEFLQGLVGAVVGLFVVYGFGLKKTLARIFPAR